MNERNQFFADYNEVVKAIESCDKPEQMESAENLISTFAHKHKAHVFAATTVNDLVWVLNKKRLSLPDIHSLQNEEQNEHGRNNATGPQQQDGERKQ